MTVSLGSAGAVTRKSLVLFAAASVIWGSSFLFIRVAVEHIPPAVVVFGRTVLGAAFLVPLAARRRAFRGLRQAAGSQHRSIRQAALKDHPASGSGNGATQGSS